MRKSIWMSGSDRKARPPLRLPSRSCRNSPRGSPYERDVDAAGHEVFLDDLARIALRVAGLRLVGHDLVEQFVLQQPVGGRRLAEHAQLERLELRRFEPQQGFWRRDAVEAPALHIRENISRAVVGLRNGRELEADRQPDDEVARESVGVRIAPAQRVADEAHALGKPRVFQLPSQLARGSSAILFSKPSPARLEKGRLFGSWHTRSTRSAPTGSAGWPKALHAANRAGTIPERRTDSFTSAEPSGLDRAVRAPRGRHRGRRGSR